MSEAPRSPEVLMPVTDTSAALQFFVEAMKQNTAVLKGVQQEQKETLKMIYDMRERVIHLESGGATMMELKNVIADLDKEVLELKRERDRRAGAVGAFEWASKFGPYLFLLLVSIIGFMVLERTP